MINDNTHTVVLIQFEKSDAATRTYLDFDNVADALDGICQMYEQQLRLKRERGELEEEKDTEHTKGGQLSYTFNEIVEYLDNLTDCCCLVFNEI